MKPTQVDSAGYFPIEKRGERFALITPSGEPFFSLGMNHIDPATLRYPENIDIWRDRYGGSQARWLKESVAPNLEEWGFNTVGWTQEVTVRSHDHSRSFSREQYEHIGLPYCHLIPFTESHQWDQFSRHYNFMSSEWEEWCDYVARAHVAEMSDDPSLIGYFYSDCPTWVHTRPVNEWRGPLFDPEKLESESGRNELFELASRYYKTTHDAIRRYDKHHLILGDRYEANDPIPMEVVDAAMPYIDVMSFQDFKEPVEHLSYWHRTTGKPVLLADAARIKWDTAPGEVTLNDGRWYSKVMSGLRDNPGCVGFHLCGAYQRNRARRYGLLDEREIPDEVNVPLIARANAEVARWIEGFSGS